MLVDTIVVGAGVAGLRCAGGLRGSGRKLVVLDRARSVGGRCATRRFDGQPVDFGPMFLHGHLPRFLEALREVSGSLAWPRQVEGGGPPCQPDALDPSTRRLAFAEGLKAFPRRLAEGLDIRLETEVTGLRVREGGFTVLTGDGSQLACRDLVLALALEETRSLLRGLPETPDLAAIQGLLHLFSSSPCLTLVAGFPLEAPAPPWDILYPADSEVLQLLAQDSTKRTDPRCRVLVAQGRARWSRERLEAPAAAWTQELLQAAAGHLGPWVLEPLWTHPHLWRYARLDSTTELAQPVRITFAQGQTLGLAGDVFSPGGGVQAAWASGARLAERMLDKERE